MVIMSTPMNLSMSSSCFVLVPCVRYGYSLKSCWFCDEKLMLRCCATHFSAFVNYYDYYNYIL